MSIETKEHAATFTPEDRVHLHELEQELTSLSVWQSGRLFTGAADDGDIWDIFIIVPYGCSEEDGTLIIGRGEDGYYLDRSSLRCDDRIAEGTTIAEVTKQWAWVLAPGPLKAIRAFRWPDLEITA
jgi:hypothetical protein